MTSTHAANIIAVARRATPAEIESGYAWYPLARAISEEIAGDAEIGAGVIAALSPRMPWDRNVNLARQACVAGRLDGGALSTNVRKVNAMLGAVPYAPASPADVLGGLKVLSFYANILDSMGDAVTIDRHAVDIAHGRIMPDSLKGKLGNKRLYAFYCDAYREAADILGIPAPELQAITWCAWRRMKGIKG